MGVAFPLPNALRLPFRFDAAARLPHFDASSCEGDRSGFGPHTSRPVRGFARHSTNPGARSRPHGLLRLGPGALVKEHRDYQIGLDFGEVRVHVPLQMEREAEFVVDGEPLRSVPANAGTSTLRKPHRLRNAGTSSRLHLVVDCVLDVRLRGMLGRAARSR